MLCRRHKKQYYIPFDDSELKKIFSLIFSVLINVKIATFKKSYKEVFGVEMCVFSKWLIIVKIIKKDCILFHILAINFAILQQNSIMCHIYLLRLNKFYTFYQYYFVYAI